MENEFHNIDDLFRDSFSDYSETPPPAVWPALEKRLDKDKKRRVFPLLRWYWLGALVVFVALLGATITANIKVSAPVTGRIDNTPEPVATNKVAEMSPVHEKAVPQTVEKVNHSEAAANKHVDSKVEIHVKRQHKNGRKNKKHQTSKTSTQTIKEDRASASDDEVSVYGNAPTVGTSIYSYDDFEQEPDFNKGRMNESSDAQNSTNTDPKHKIVVAESYNPDAHSGLEPESESTGSLVGSAANRTTVAMAGKENAAPVEQNSKPSGIERVSRTGKKEGTRRADDGERKSSKIASANRSEPQRTLAARSVKTRDVANSSSMASKGSVATRPAASARSTSITHDADAKGAAKTEDRKTRPQKTTAVAATQSKVNTASERDQNKATFIARHNGTNSSKPMAVVENAKRRTAASATTVHLDKIEVSANLRAAHAESGKGMGTRVVAHKLPVLASGPGIPQAATSKTPGARSKVVELQKQQVQKLQTEVGDIAVSKDPGARVSPEPVQVAPKPAMATNETNADQGKPAVDRLLVATPVPAAAKQETTASARRESAAIAEEDALTTVPEKNAPVKKPVVDKNAKLPPVVAAAATVKAVSLVEKEVALAPKHLPEAQPVALSAKKAIDTATAPAAIAEPEEECPDSTAEGITPFMKFVFGIKGGLESGFSLDAGNKVLIAPYIRYNLSEKVGIQLQPALKVGRLSTRTIGPAAYYHDIHAGTGQYELTGTSLVYLVFSGDTLVRRDYTYTEKYDSIIKQNQVGGSYAEVELPILLQYQAGKRLSVYGGLNTVIGKRFSIEEKTKTYRDVTATGQGFSLTRVNEPAILPPNSGVVYTSSPLSSYGGAQYPANGGSILRMGYMLGVSYELKKRWSVDAAVQQCFLQKNIQGGYNVNKALSAPYFRVTVGYRLSK